MHSRYVNHLIPAFCKGNSSAPFKQVPSALSCNLPGQHPSRANEFRISNFFPMEPGECVHFNSVTNCRAALQWTPFNAPFQPAHSPGIFPGSLEGNLVRQGGRPCAPGCSHPGLGAGKGTRRGSWGPLAFTSRRGDFQASELAWSTEGPGVPWSHFAQPSPCCPPSLDQSPVLTSEAGSGQRRGFSDSAMPTPATVHGGCQVTGRLTKGSQQNWARVLGWPQFPCL